MAITCPILINNCSFACFTLALLRHHVEVHNDDWWINKFESYGFRYSPSLTTQIKEVAREERGLKEMGPNGKPYNAAHIWLHMQVFINPMVASLPQHAHLFSEPGCYKGRGEKNKILHRDCGSDRQKVESVLPDSFHPLILTPEQDDAWFRKIQDHIIGNVSSV
jgi:hypothetical protein